MKKILFGLIGLSICSFSENIPTSGYIKSESVLGLASFDKKLNQTKYLLNQNLDLGIGIGKNKEGFIFVKGGLKQTNFPDEMKNGKEFSVEDSYIGARLDYDILKNLNLKTNFIYDNYSDDKEENKIKNFVEVLKNQGKLDESLANKKRRIK